MTIAEMIKVRDSIDNITLMDYRCGSSHPKNCILKESQANEIIKLLRPILPLSIETISLEVRIPAEYAVRAYGSVKGYGTIRSEKWHNDGSWSSIIDMSAGLYQGFLDKLGKITKGTIHVKMIKK